MYNHEITNMEGVSLHDCRARSGSCRDGVLTFDFEDGIYINGFETGKASVRFHPTDDVTVYVFKDKKRGKAIRREKSVKWLLSKVNKGKVELEFLYGYKGYGTMIYECMIWTNRRPYHHECQLMIPVQEIQYCWNEE